MACRCASPGEPHCDLGKVQALSEANHRCEQRIGDRLQSNRDETTQSPPPRISPG
jgi:hypothetical protein